MSISNPFTKDVLIKIVTEKVSLKTISYDAFEEGQITGQLPTTRIPGEDIHIELISSANTYIDYVECSDINLTPTQANYSSFYIKMPNTNIVFTINVKNNISFNISKDKRISEVVISSDYNGNNVITGAKPDQSIYIHSLLNTLMILFKQKLTIQMFMLQDTA